MNGELTRSDSRTALDVSLLVMRVIVGVIFAAHGSQKMFGLFGGPGLSAMMSPEMLGPVLGLLVSIGEFFGGLGLVFGVLNRFSAFWLIVIMLGAIGMVHGQHGFFLQNQGFEYNIALIGLLTPILLLGPGRFAVCHSLPLPKSRRTGRTIAVLE